MQGALDTRAKLASPARKEDEERDEKGSQKLIGRLDRSHQQLFQQQSPEVRVVIPLTERALRAIQQRCCLVTDPSLKKLSPKIVLRRKWSRWVSA
jgi:hypothetical protein